MKKIFFFLAVLWACSPAINAQDDLLDLLGDDEDTEVVYTSATFKSTRVVNSHSIERMQAGQLDFRIHHRFGRLNTGWYELWGLDQASMKFSFEYGVTDWLMLGVGRATFEKTYDGFAKVSLLRQSTGARNMPVSLSLLSSVVLSSLKWEDPTRVNYFSSRLSYGYQVLLARKFNQRFSLQLMPTMVHRNLVPTELDPNDLYALGIGGRLKLTSRISLNAEYFYVLKLSQFYSTEFYNPLSIGFDIETGGHVFTLLFTNSLPMTEPGFIGQTTGKWGRGDIHFGFNLSRVFTLK
ncbi:MAG: DUF5777 family beta-barrel protein [Bacteroidota bacterium]